MDLFFSHFPISSLLDPSRRRKSVLHVRVTGLLILRWSRSSKHFLPHSLSSLKLPLLDASVPSLDACSQRWLWRYHTRSVQCVAAAALASADPLEKARALEEYRNGLRVQQTYPHTPSSSPLHVHRAMYGGKGRASFARTVGTRHQPNTLAAAVGGFQSALFSASFSKDGSMLFTACQDGSISLYETVYTTPNPSFLILTHLLVTHFK